MKNLAARDPGDQSSFPCSAGCWAIPCIWAFVSPHAHWGKEPYSGWALWPPWALPTSSLIKETKDAGTRERLSFRVNIMTSGRQLSQIGM